MIDLIASRDLIYTITGLALLGLTLQPALARYRLFNLPLIHVAIGAALGAMGLPVISPLGSELQTKVLEHASELIVIISLAGAGLAIDTPEGWWRWQPTWRLLGVTMPLTIAGIAVAGVWGLGLGLASALLLAAALAPTDPVLARAVQVDGPGRKDSAMGLALTGEAGLNDGLAFPFVYLAIHVAAMGSLSVFGAEGWGWSWLGFDLVYRVIGGIVIGWGVGHVLSRVITSPLGDASHGAWNSIVVVLAATFISYGLAESVSAYGFLAVFVAARAGRANTRGTEHEEYEKYVHHGADQLEAILLALLLLWLGTFIGAGALKGTRWEEVVFALGLIFVLRPLSGLIALIGYDCSGLQRINVAFFGLRGMGSIFYIAYGQTHAEFDEIALVWRVAVLTILISIVIHGFAANIFIEDGEEEEEQHPYKSRARRESSG